MESSVIDEINKIIGKYNAIKKDINKYEEDLNNLHKIKNKIDSTNTNELLTLMFPHSHESALKKIESELIFNKNKNGYQIKKAYEIIANLKEQKIIYSKLLNEVKNLIDKTMEVKESDQIKCNVCYDIPGEIVIYYCSHWSCTSCFNKINRSDNRVCQVCRSGYMPYKKCKLV